MSVRVERGRVRLGLRRFAVVAAFAGAACTTSHTATSPAGGSILVFIEDSVPGVAPDVVVTGPGGYHHTMSDSATLTLAQGTYQITAQPVVISSPVVDSVYTAEVNPTPVTVIDGRHVTVGVQYFLQGGSGRLWTVGGTNDHGNRMNGATAYTASQLAASSSAAPSVTLSFPLTLGGNVDASGVVFDKSGNMWVANDNSNTVVAYAPSALGSTGAPSPSITLSGPALTSAYALAFDAQGNLWVANINANSIVEIPAAQLETSGAPVPAVTITDGPSGAPDGLAFDASGNLWVANNLLNTVSEYTPNQLATGGALTPAVVLSGSGFLRPQGLAFDVHGNLWVANTAVATSTGTIVEYAASLLAASGSPAPTLTLTPPGNSGPEITAVAFDNSGNLWYTDFANPGVGEYTAASLAAGGTPSPAVVVSGVMPGVALAFSPHLAALPLH